MVQITVEDEFMKANRNKERKKEWKKERTGYVGSMVDMKSDNMKWQDRCRQPLAENSDKRNLECRVRQGSTKRAVVSEV